MEGLTPQSKKSPAFASEILSDRQPEVVMWNEGPCHVPSTNFTPMSSALQHLQGQLPGQEYDLLSQESVWVTSILPEGTNPHLSQFPPDFSLFNTSELDAQQFPSSTSQHGTGFEGQSSFDPSTSGYQERHVPVAHGGQERVKCTWSRCSRVVNKDSYTRHVDEIHLRKVKAVCARCGRAFPRTYMKKNHELACRGRH